MWSSRDSINYACQSVLKALLNNQGKAGIYHKSLNFVIFANWNALSKIMFAIQYIQ